MTTTTPPPRTGLRAWARAEAAATEPIAALTERQLQVLRGFADGKTYDEIARELWLSRATVKCHVGLLLDNLRARNAAHAVAIGYQAGLLPGGDGR